ncbi:MAG: cupredoxin domain-containing protein [Chloroflexota bacterium]|nr:cupredoxin domain-containing protein [Chloroflexota bacterium]
MRKLKFMAMLAVAAALVVGCAAAATPAKGGTVNATLTEMKIALDKTSLPAGPITFVVKNSGTVVHELVVLQTDVAEDKLVPDAAQAGKVVETGNLAETGDVNAGESKSFTVTLPAGRYVLMCNQVGHYAGGMHLTFTVN